MGIMYDSVTVGTVPANAPAVAGYTSGFWPTYLPLVHMFPALSKQKRVVSIAIHGQYDADALDCESGDAALTDAPAWVERQLARGLHRPIVYTSISNIPELMGLLKAHGIGRTEVRVWAAHKTETAHLCGDGTCQYNPGFVVDATQWTWTALGRNLDESLVNDTFFGVVKPAFNPHYDWLFDEPTFRERSTVQAYDKLRNRSLPFILAHRPQIKKLRGELKKLAVRVLDEAKTHPDKDGHPSYGEFHRGWRYQALIQRAYGKRIG